MTPSGDGPARSFGGVALEYERGRPGYPDDAIPWLVGDRQGMRVLDLGAGTGKLTRQLSRAGHEVVAVEPLFELIDQLRAACPGVPVIAARAERLPVRSGWFDGVTVAQAFHWFDHDLASEEIAMVLRRGGYLGVVWNVRDESVPWVAALSELIGGERVDSGWTAARGLSAHFGPVEERSFRMTQIVDRDQLLALVASRSYVASRSADERERLLEQVGILCDTHPDVRGRATFELPYVTFAYRAVRN